MKIQAARFSSPLGPLVLYARERRPEGTLIAPLVPDRALDESGVLCGLGFDSYDNGLHVWLQRRFGELEVRPARDPFGFVAAVQSYFDGRLQAFDTIPADPGGTDFQRRVWTALRAIPAGRTLSYRGLATAIGQPTAVRAVGLANGRNPVCPVLPCHRVIASDGSLHGYGGGLERKRWLLRHEGAAFAERGRQLRLEDTAAR